MASKDLTVQNKLIIAGLALSTLAVFAIAGFAITKIQERLSEGYTSFGQILTKTLAVETYELTKGLSGFEKYDILQSHATSIISSNKEISYIEFKEGQNVVYSTKENFPQRANNTKISINSPIFDVNNNIMGSVSVGLSGDMITNVTRATKDSMTIVFTLAWLVFSAIVLINTFLITRELRILHQGVKAISGGEFGTVLNDKTASGEIKELFGAFNDMSTRLHLYEEQNIEQLTLERNKFEAILMSIANGVVVCDNYDNVVMINNPAEHILEVKAENIIGSKIQNYYDNEEKHCFLGPIERFKDLPLEEVLASPLEFNAEIDSKSIKAVMSPIFSKSKDYLGYIIVLIDLTKEAQIDKLKSNFISNVSHELRTPVTVLRSYIDTLYECGDDFKYEEQKEFIGVINNEIIRLNKMVNDVLDFSRLEANLKIEKHKGDIMKTVEAAVEGIKVLAQNKNITFSIVKQPELPQILYNEEAIEGVMNNLLTNAIKYSGEKSKIRIRAQVSKDSNYVEISVKDRGIGISQEHIEKIFDRFYRIENDTHTIKGTGLGLNLVKSAIEKHHSGEVFVKSKPGLGSTFGFRLPIEPCEDVVVAPKALKA